MEINYPEAILRKSDGTTDTEKYLAKLCQNTFLSMWSYPNIYRDQRERCAEKNGKEICDLLVVFENHLIIFSDKECSFPRSGNIQIDWSRWYRKAVKDSAVQIWGAERWILNYPKRVFLDKACLNKFPLPLPTIQEAKVHRVVVAHAASRECTAQMGGSGSLMIVPGIIGDMHISGKSGECFPFAIGQINPQKGYVHVFDDTSLDIVMNTLDTISDFIVYLEKKEFVIASGKLGFAAGEEELLAYYLQHSDSDGNHDFVIEPGFTGLLITEGLWSSFEKHPRRKAQIEANRISYSWDGLIDKFLIHLFAGTSYYLSGAKIAEQEKGFRFLARENRTRRRMLATAINELIQKTPQQMRATRTVLPSRPGDPYYVFLLLPKPEHVKYERYREVRSALLEKYCLISKLHFPNAVDIIGIATETGLKEERSEDLAYLDARGWTEDENRKAQDIESELRKLGLFSDSSRYEQRIKEYPEVESSDIKLKGAFRNEPCPCGSGKKYKRCCLS